MSGASDSIEPGSQGLPLDALPRGSSAPAPADAGLHPADIVRQAEQALAGEPLHLGAERSGGPALRLKLDARLKAFTGALREKKFLGWDAIASRRPPATLGMWLGCAAAALAICIVLFSLPVDWRAPSFTIASAPEEQRWPSNAPDLPPAEERPPVGAGLQFSQANMRYCTFQQIRLEAVGPLIDAADLGVFNAHVDDWNARCPRYRYAPADKEAIDAEAAARRALLEAEGRGLMSGWRRKIATTGAVALAGGDASGAEPLPLLIRLGRASADDPDRDAGVPAKLPSLALLRVDVAMRVQKRLNELGYVIAPADGTWGAMSRNALRRFKEANGLLVNDAFDAETAARLFSTAAVNAPPGAISPDDAVGAIETAYPPPPAAGMNPLNRADGQRIQRRLAALGYYAGRGDGPWGAASRNALRNFKLMNGLPDNDEWNAITEAVLLDEQAVRATDPVTRARAGAPPASPAAAAKRPPSANAKPNELTASSATGDAPRPRAPVPGSSTARPPAAGAPR